MDTVLESDAGLEFRHRLAPVTRGLMLLAGLLPLLAPYELLLRPRWTGGGAFWWFAAALSAGAVAVSLLVVAAALFGLNQRLRFDVARRVVLHGYSAALLRHREAVIPFANVTALRVKPHAWSDGPTTYNLALALRNGREVEFGGFTDAADADRYASTLNRMLARA